MTVHRYFFCYSDSILNQFARSLGSFALFCDTNADVVLPTPALKLADVWKRKSIVAVDSCRDIYFELLTYPAVTECYRVSGIKLQPDGTRTAEVFYTTDPSKKKVTEMSTGNKYEIVKEVDFTESVNVRYFTYTNSFAGEMNRFCEKVSLQNSVPYATIYLRKSFVTREVATVTNNEILNKALPAFREIVEVFPKKFLRGQQIVHMFVDDMAIECLERQAPTGTVKYISTT